MGRLTTTWDATSLLRRTLSACAAAALLLSAGSARAQEFNWRYDYYTARR